MVLLRNSLLGCEVDPRHYCAVEVLKKTVGVPFQANTRAML